MVKISTLTLLFAAASAHAALPRRHRTLARRFGSDCPKDLGSFISGEMAQLNPEQPGSRSSTYIDANGVPVNVNVKETITKDPGGGSSKLWSWFWSSSSTGTNAHSSSPTPPDPAPPAEPARVVSSKSHEYQYVHNYGHQGNKSYDSSHYAYSSSLIVNDYVITSHVSKSGNPAPFNAAQVEWLKEHDFPARITVPSGAHIPRPADAGICNAKFPFSGQTYHAANPRFESAYPAHRLDSMSKRALELHNIERARYGLELLQWNPELANMAACWADLKAYGHSEDHFCATGENIAYGYGAPCYTTPLIGMENAINSFLDEDRAYAAKRQFGEDTGHWTQIVWKDTKYVGCATSQRKNFLDEEDTSIYVVCEYYPAGNVMGQFELQVPEPNPVSHYRSQCSAHEMHWS